MKKMMLKGYTKYLILSLIPFFYTGCTVTAVPSTTPVVYSDISPVMAMDEEISVLENQDYSGRFTVTGGIAENYYFTVDRAPSLGAVHVDPTRGTYVYEPDPRQIGSDSFSFVVSDGVTTVTGHILVNILPVRQTLVAKNSSLTVFEDGRKSDYFNIQGSYTNDLRFSMVSSPRHGTLHIIDARTGSYEYTPVPGYDGNDSFSFKVSDSYADSNIATVYITVQRVGTNPVALNANFIMNENGTYTDYLSANSDNGNTLRYIIVTQPTQGALTAFDNNTGRFTYRPDTNVIGNDSFSFKVFDGVNYSNTSIVRISIQ